MLIKKIGGNWHKVEKWNDFIIGYKSGGIVIVNPNIPDSKEFYIPFYSFSGLEIVGSEKLIFGSDFPFAKPIETLGLLKFLKGLSARDLENILYNNIITLLQFQE
jgi:predicted TIM-barrel fold metal-dependent hydrolase